MGSRPRDSRYCGGHVDTHPQPAGPWGASWVRGARALRGPRGGAWHGWKSKWGTQTQREALRLPWHCGGRLGGREEGGDEEGPRLAEGAETLLGPLLFSPCPFPCPTTAPDMPLEAPTPPSTPLKYNVFLFPPPHPALPFSPPRPSTGVAFGL